MRSISRWVAPPLSSVQMVVCRCGFKTFNLGLPRDKGAESNVLPVGPRGARRTGLSASDQRGQGGAVWVAISGALWVAAGALRNKSSLGISKSQRQAQRVRPVGACGQGGVRGGNVGKSQACPYFHADPRFSTGSRQITWFQFGRRRHAQPVLCFRAGGQGQRGRQSRAER